MLHTVFIGRSILLYSTLCVLDLTLSTLASNVKEGERDRVNVDKSAAFTHPSLQYKNLSLQDEMLRSLSFGLNCNVSRIWW